MTATHDERTAADAVQALLDASVDAIVIVSCRGVIEAFSPAAERLFGYSSVEAKGNNVSLLMPEPHKSAHDGFMERHLATGEAHIVGIGREIQARRKDGSIFPAWLAVGRIQNQHPDSAAPGFVGFVHDLSLRHQAAEQERRSARRLAEISRLDAMAELAAEIAHEVNQPLAAITNYAKACERLLGSSAAGQPETRSDVQEALRQIADQALRAGDNIRRLRELINSRAHESSQHP